MYQNYIYIVDRDKIDKLRKMSVEEHKKWVYKKSGVEKWEGDMVSRIDKESIIIPPHMLGREVHSLGGYYELDEWVREQGKPLYHNTKVQELYRYYMPYIITKSILKEMIEYERSKIEDYYTGMLNYTEKEYKEYIRLRKLGWVKYNGRMGEVNIDEGCVGTVEGDRREYKIFDLVRVYKETDYKKYSLMYMGR